MDITFLRNILESIAMTMTDASFYLLIGFFCAGLLKALIPPGAIVRHIGRPNMASVLKASCIGTPMPLCSCSVIPMAVSLRKNGASKGATVSFLISAPETGVDSIAISYAMLDPLMTVFRPVSAFVTALFAGVLENGIRTREKRNLDLIQTQTTNCDDTDCGCHSGPSEAEQEKPVFKRIGYGLRYAFTDLLGDIAYYLVIGLIVSGIITALVPDDFFVRYLGNEALTMFIMLVIGIPMYVCASASTPIAAALILKGISPGAALVFLLAGPATNVSTMGMVRGLLGKTSFYTYMFSITVSALLLGSLLNTIYDYFDISMRVNLGTASEIIPEWMKVISALILLPLLLRALFMEVRHRFEKK